MKKLYIFICCILSSIAFGQAFHDTRGNIDVSGGGQLQYTLPIALPPGVKSVAPQINLVYTSGAVNGIAGYGWSLSGITSISRMSKTIERDGEVKGIQLDGSDFFSFNGQRLLLKSGTYGAGGAEYVTEKFSNVKIRSVGSVSGNGWSGPEYWEVTFEDGSQGWYGGSSESRTPVEYNISRWKDAQGNVINYQYEQPYNTNVAVIKKISWGGNEGLGTGGMNEINFNYTVRALAEESYSNGVRFVQNSLLSEITVATGNAQFKKYVATYNTLAGTYQTLQGITEYNSQGEAANPVIFTYDQQAAPADPQQNTHNPSNFYTKKYGDLNYDGDTDYLEYRTDNTLYFKPSIYDASAAVQISYDPSKFTAGDFSLSQLITFAKGGVVKNRSGLVVPHRISSPDPNTAGYDFQVYSVDIDARRLVFEYSKFVPGSKFMLFTDEDDEEGLGTCTTVPTSIADIEPYDYNGDGISELLVSFSARRRCVYRDDPYERLEKHAGAEAITARGAASESRRIDPAEGGQGVAIPSIDGNNTETGVPLPEEGQNPLDGLRQDYIIPPGGHMETYTRSSFALFDLEESKSSDQSFNVVERKSDGLTPEHTFVDFNGDGIQEVVNIKDGSISEAYTLKYAGGVLAKSPVPQMAGKSFAGYSKGLMYTDVNGDGKTDVLIPVADKGSSWNLYISTGNGFVQTTLNNFIYYSADQEILSQGKHNRWPESTCIYSSLRLHQYTTADLDGDGKYEVIVTRLNITNHEWSAHYDKESTTAETTVYSPTRLLNGGYDESYPASGYGVTFYKTASWSKTVPEKVIPFGMLAMNRNNRQVILVGRPDDCGKYDCDYNEVIKYNYQYLPELTKARMIIQGGLATYAEYRELVPDHSQFYRASTEPLYPYMQVERVYKSYAVSQLRQVIPVNGQDMGRYQDFRYRGFITHLQGRGMVGFRQTARSSWYGENTRATIIWSGAEMDPLQDGVPVKEWSIKTNDENQIFPSDLSINNSQLLSFKSTQYRNDALAYGVRALIPVTTISKDFQRDITTTSTVSGYNEYYLPTQTVSSINGGFATTTTSLEYLHNPGGTGKDYFIGRPKSKTETIQVYGDSKGAKEDYEYENNLLKSKTSWNLNNSGWIREAYSYDGFGNTTSKTISNSADANTQTEGAEYEPSGRFVVRKTDNLGLQTNIGYNGWGQVLEQTDPLGNKLTNTYDTWGKLLTSKTNLGGTTTYAYEKFYNGDARITEYSPDGDEKSTYTNKIGQNYKTRAKSVNSGRYVSRDIQYDELGRKTAESEPYFEGEGASKWNTIEYDAFSRPVKAASFTGKVVESSYNGRTVTVTETNANNRFKKQTADPLGNIISSEDKGGVINFKFNAGGQVTEAKYGSNTVTTKYDEWGRKSEFHDPSNGLYKYLYNPFGQVLKETSPKGYKEYTYNGLGQLVSQREAATDGTQNTDKAITYAYNDKGLIISKNGSSNGKAFGSSISYDDYGRILSTTESGNDRSFWQSGIAYDDKSRVASYEKGLYSNGVTTKVTVENVYDSWSGELFQLKDKNTGRVLWELQEVNAKGQVTRAKLGATDILNLYDQNGFLTNTGHTAANRTILQVGYSFNAIKNELNSRTTGGDFNILESFNYDDNNRLVSWTNPRTGAMSSNGYDAEGRIRENDALGSVKFENNQSAYRPSSVVLNAAGQQRLADDLLQKIVYNENNDPVTIDGVRGDARFEYGLTEMRQKVDFGGSFLRGDLVEIPGGLISTLSRPRTSKFTRYYSEDGSFEVTVDNRTGEEKHVLYIGGSPYESNIVFVKNYTESGGSYKFLHKDYLGSILAISDEAGNKIEQRHYDAWGNLTHLQVGGGVIMTDENQIRDFMSNGGLLLDRGYTSHEHFAELGLIHMNGRLYDPLLRRFLNADENIQDMFNTQNYNKYGYVLNNPLMFGDPSGEFFVFLGLGVLFWKAVIIGAAIGLASYTVGLAVTGNIKQWNIGGALKSMFWGAVSGAVTFGIGSIFSVVKDGVQVATSFAKALGEVGTAFVQAGAHAVAQGALSLMQGGSFSQAFWSGALGSLGASAFGAIAGNVANKAVGQIAFGALSGGIGAELTGGNFWQGAIIGGMVAGFNHAMHSIDGPGDPSGKKTSQDKQPWDLNGDGILQKNEADNWWLTGKGADIWVDNSLIDWGGLEMPLSTPIGKTFSIDTYSAFIDLPYETAATYGGTSFVRTGSRTATVIDQKYHYDPRPNNSIKNIVRNFMNWYGKPSLPWPNNIPKLQGVDYMIHYQNPQIKFK